FSDRCSSPTSPLASGSDSAGTQGSAGTLSQIAAAPPRRRLQAAPIRQAHKGPQGPFLRSLQLPHVAACKRLRFGRHTRVRRDPFSDRCSSPTSPLASGSDSAGTQGSAGTLVCPASSQQQGVVG